MWAFAGMAGAATTVFGRLDRLPRLERPNVRLSEKAFIGFLLGFSTFVMVWAVASLPVTMKLVWLTDVRDQRAAFSEAVGASSGLFGYLFRWQSARSSPRWSSSASTARPVPRCNGCSGADPPVRDDRIQTGPASLVFVPATYYLLRRPRMRVRPAAWIAGGLVVSSWVAVALDQITHSIDFKSVFVRVPSSSPASTLRSTFRSSVRTARTSTHIPFLPASPIRPMTPVLL